MSSTLHTNFTRMQKKLALKSVHFPLKESTQLYSMFKVSRQKQCGIPSHPLTDTEKKRMARMPFYRDYISMPGKRILREGSQVKTVGRSLKSCLKLANGPKSHKVVTFNLANG